MSSAELRENRTLGWSASGDGRPSVAPRVKTICGTSRFNEAAARGARSDRDPFRFGGRHDPHPV